MRDELNVSEGLRRPGRRIGPTEQRGEPRRMSRRFSGNPAFTPCVSNPLEQDFARITSMLMLLIKSPCCSSSRHLAELWMASLLVADGSSERANVRFAEAGSRKMSQPLSIVGVNGTKIQDIVPL